MDIVLAHKFSSRHREAIMKSQKCGCFYCLNIFDKNQIGHWVDEEQTAICPKCGIDSVLSDFDVKFDKDFLEKMNKYWF